MGNYGSYEGMRHQEGRCRPNRLQERSVNQGDIGEQGVWGQANNSWLGRLTGFRTKL